MKNEVRPRPCRPLPPLWSFQVAYLLAQAIAAIPDHAAPGLVAQMQDVLQQLLTIQGTTDEKEI